MQRTKSAHNGCESDFPMSHEPMSQPLALLRVAETPRLFVVPEFASPQECAALRALTANQAALAALGVETQTQETGRSGELPVDQVPQLQVLSSRLEGLLGVSNRVGSTWRLREYLPGQGHPPHLDRYEIAGYELLATALLCIEAPLAGGQTVFGRAPEGPLVMAHKEGQLVVWYNVQPDGGDSVASRHLGAPVLSGTKQILGYFVYAPIHEVLSLSAGTRAPAPLRQQIRTVAPEQRGEALRGFGRTLTIVDDGVPKETVSLLVDACENRGVQVTMVDPRRFDFSATEPLPDGSLLYRPAVSLLAGRVEQALWQPKVATFATDLDGPLFSNIAAHETFLRAGLPVPRTFPLAGTDRDLLRTYVDALGGLPVVVKALGYSRGIGTIRVDSLPSLFSVVDYMMAEGGKPLLCAYIPDAVHWRLVVVGDAVVSAYINATDSDDFRTSGSDDPEDYRATPPPGMAEIAVASCKALRHAHGGVDVLWHPSGRMYLLESNFPCYYAQSQIEAGTDIAGPMVDWLLARADLLTSS